MTGAERPDAETTGPHGRGGALLRLIDAALGVDEGARVFGWRPRRAEGGGPLLNAALASDEATVSEAALAALSVSCAESEADGRLALFEADAALESRLRSFGYARDSVFMMLEARIDAQRQVAREAPRGVVILELRTELAAWDAFWRGAQPGAALGAHAGQAPGCGAVRLVARLEARFAGGLIAASIEDALVIGGLTVAPFARRRGLGAALVARLEEIAIRIGAARIIAAAPLGAEGAGRLWLSAGFSEIERATLLARRAP